MLTKTQKVGAGVAVGGATAVIVGAGIAGYLFTQNMKVGASPSDLVMQILGLLFGGGIPLTIGGILTAVISWFRNRNNPNLPSPNQPVIPLTPNTPINSIDDPRVQAIPFDIKGVSGPELTELTLAFFAFLKDRNNVPNQKRLLIALTGIADVIPNLRSAVEVDELVFRYKMSVLAASKLVTDPRFVPVSSATIPLNQGGAV